MKFKFAWPLFVAALFLSAASLALPLLFQLMPFPSLDDARHLEGTVEVQLTHTIGRDRSGQMAKIYIQTARERIEIDCGYLMDRWPCPNFYYINGWRGEVWYHRIFGVVQWHLIKPDTGEVFYFDREDVKFHYEHDVRYEKYFKRLIYAIGLLVAILIFNRK